MEWKKHPEYVSFLKEYIPGHSCKEIMESFTKQFGISLKKSQIGNFKTKYKVLAGVNSGWFQKGHTPTSKGEKLSEEHYEKIRKTMFQKGHVTWNCRRINSEYITKAGYVLVKVSNSNKKWRLKHRVVWEREHGAIPKGHRIVFLDGNKQNTDISNLALVSSAEQVRLNTDGFNNCKNPELTKSRIQLAKLKLEIGKKKKRYEKISQHID